MSMKGNTLSIQIDFGDPKLISRNGVNKDSLRIKILTNDTLVELSKGYFIKMGSMVWKDIPT